MTGRREAILDAAIHVLGTTGSRGLTHRAVDSAAGIPHGSTSNVFRTRGTLIAGVVARMEELDYEIWTSQSPQAAIDSLEGLVDFMTRIIHASVTSDRIRTQARYALFIEAAVAGADSSTARSVERSRGNLIRWGIEIATAVDIPSPDAAAITLADYLDGAILHRLTSEAAEIPRVRAGVEHFVAGLASA